MLGPLGLGFESWLLNFQGIFELIDENIMIGKHHGEKMCTTKTGKYYKSWYLLYLVKQVVKYLPVSTALSPIWLIS